ncbi:MAG: methyltransferase domain-containing protein [Thaumarchaeota archaeon]|nr:methyltransferase domain-containing protein [Nitrososphaerota archaeon]
MAEYWNSAAETYDFDMAFLLKTLFVDEDAERENIISLLQLRSDSKVLEIGCGTGRDTEKMVKRLGKEGLLRLTDISPNMLKICEEKIFGCSVPFEMLIHDASAPLPFDQRTFDVVFHFGALNEFKDKKFAMSEMVRVAKVGGKIVVGDESVPEWLRETEFGKMLMAANPRFKATVPLDAVPKEARDVKVHYIMNSVYYLIEFRVGEGEPKVDETITFPGRRGGTYRSRYEESLKR